MSFKRNTQVIVLIESNKSELLSGKVKDIIKSQPIIKHKYDFVENVKENGSHLIIEISLDL